MTYSIVPIQNQSPGVFPFQGQTNFTRLKTIIGADHQFNDSGSSTDGAHKQMTMVNRLDPTGVPVGTNSMIYGKSGLGSVNEIWYYNGVYTAQMDWREVDGIITLNTGSFTNVFQIPQFCYGTCLFFNPTALAAPPIASGSFVSNATVTNGFANQLVSASFGSEIIRLGNGLDGASGLFLRARVSTSATGFNNAEWRFRLFYRAYT